MKKIEALKSITDELKFSEMVYDLVRVTDTPEELSVLLSEEFTEEGLQTVGSIAQSDYPLSFDRKQ